MDVWHQMIMLAPRVIYMVNIQHLFLYIYNASLGQSAEKPVGLFCWFKMAFCVFVSWTGRPHKPIKPDKQMFFSINMNYI